MKLILVVVVLSHDCCQIVNGQGSHSFTTTTTTTTARLSAATESRSIGSQQTSVRLSHSFHGTPTHSLMTIPSHSILTTPFSHSIQAIPGHSFQATPSRQLNTSMRPRVSNRYTGEGESSDLSPPSTPATPLTPAVPDPAPPPRRGVHRHAKEDNDSSSCSSTEDQSAGRSEWNENPLYGKSPPGRRKSQLVRPVTSQHRYQCLDLFSSIGFIRFKYILTRYCQ